MENILAEIMDLVKLLLPIIILNYILVAYCIFTIIKRGVSTLTPLIWILIVLFINGFGPIGYLIWGRNKNYDKD